MQDLARAGHVPSVARYDPRHEHLVGARSRPIAVHAAVGRRAHRQAFAAILLSGLAGAMIGYSLIALQCDGDCGLAKGLGLLVGAIVAAGGMAIVAVLVMRAIGEWREVEDRTGAGHAPR